MKHPIIIDTDPGIDDAAAIAIGLNNPKLDVRMITTTFGNVSVTQTTNNALKLKQFFQSPVPVYKGASQPLNSKMVDAKDVHGETGLAGYDFEPPDLNLLSPTHAVEAMRNELLNSEEKITLVPIGPLTNIALLLKMYPEVQDKIKAIVLMGGSAARGNITPLAEFNIYNDPEAASIVFNSGLTITMVGLDVARSSTLKLKDIEELTSLGKTGAMLSQLFQHYRGDDFKLGANVYDAYTLLYLLHPDKFEVHQAKVQIELQGTYTRGATVTQFDSLSPNATVVMSIHPETFKHLFFNTLNYAK